jgi:hypothetical protein
MPQFEPDDFEVLYPGVFTDKEKTLAEKYISDNKAIAKRGAIDVKALIEGRLSADTPGLLPVVPVAEDMVRYNNKKYDPENPVLNDAEYARKLGYKDILAMPCFGAHDDSFMTPPPGEMRDMLCVSQLNHSVNSYLPVYPGDTLFMVADSRTVTDLTPLEGSMYRSLVIRTEGSVYNQKGEKVNSCIWRVMESSRSFRPGRKPADFGPADVWDAPEWIKRPAHCYTDEDWDFIKGVWSKERRQGAEPLYWEEVKIGDEPVWTADGPIDDTVMPTAPFGMGTGGTRTLKTEIMDPELCRLLIRGEADGVYRTPDRDDYAPPIPENPGTAVQIPAFEGDGAVDTRDIHRLVAGARAPLINFYGRDIALRHINNWMGDHGWVYNISWGLMPARTMEAYGKPVPANPDAVRFLDRVPHMAGSYANAHGLTRDLALVRSYVYDKYVRDGRFFVDLAWWIETIEGDIWLEGCATVGLPSKRAR